MRRNSRQRWSFACGSQGALHLLTEDKPKLLDILPTGGFDAKEFLRFTASLEQNSDHPLAAAIVQGAKECL